MTKWLFPVLLVVCTGSMSAMPMEHRIHIPDDESQWVNRIYVLLRDDVSDQELSNMVLDLHFSPPSARLIPALRDARIVRASFLLPSVDNLLAVNSWEPARRKLARFFFVDLDPSEDPSRILMGLAEMPEVEYAGIDVQLSQVTSADCGGNTLINQYGNFTKTWGMQATRLSQLWSIARGHSYIGVIDLGIDHNHHELRDFSGSSFAGGNFHRHLGLDIGNRFSTTGSGAHPFVGGAVFGEVDEYHVKVVQGYLNCDTNGNNDGFNQMKFAGHGTHVAGLIAGRGANSFGWHGACRHCPLQISRFSFAAQCQYGNQDHTGKPFEAISSGTLLGAAASIAFSIDFGTQIINFSGGAPNYTSGFCSSNPNDPMCLALKYATDRDVMIFASSGNEAKNSQNWPAIDPTVYGVSGTQPGGGFWRSGTGCGSNFGTNSTNGPSFSAPAKGVYSSMYPDMNYNPSACHEYNDGVPGDGYGFCIGTSMSAPFLSGIAGVVRSLNPLASRADVFQAIRQTTNRALAGLGYSNQFGWGVPRADDAAKKMLGVSNGFQVKNRLTPLFNLYSSVAKDFANTTKPQVALAFATNSVRQYTGYTSSPLVAGYTFKESSGNPSPPQPRADVFLLTSHVSPNQNAVRPLYRMRYLQAYAGNPNNWDTVLVWESEIQGFRSVGYELEGIEGYVYNHCTPDCIPTGAVKLYRAYKSTDDDHAIFPQSRLTAMQNLGFTTNLKLLGYAYPNLDSDVDGLIDGMEYILGTNPFSQDSNCNGIKDGVRYPPFGLPVADPLLPNWC